MKTKDIRKALDFISFSILLSYLFSYLLNHFGFGLGIDLSFLGRAILPAFLYLSVEYIIIFLLSQKDTYRKTELFLANFSKLSFLVSKPVFKYFLTPVLLLSLGAIIVVLSVTKSKQFTTVLTKNYSNVEFEGTTGEIFGDNKAQAEFIATENNLGIVAIRFNTFERTDENKLRFKISEKGSEIPIYENLYKTDQFQQDKFFTFGFPVIKNSKGKLYALELEPATATESAAVAISSKSPRLQTRYKFSQSYLVKNPCDLMHFAIGKTGEMLPDPNFITLVVLAISPLFIYLLWLIKGEALFYGIKSVEDWFALTLLFYLSLELITQIGRITNTLWENNFTGNYLDWPKKTFLFITILLGIIVTLKGEKKLSA
jgi:hypothetical protein